MRSVRWTRRALGRLDNIGLWIAAENPAAADKVVSRIIAAVDRLSDYPEIGRPGRLKGTRELPMADIPYIVAYKVTSKTIDILTVLHTSRKWPETL